MCPMCQRHPEERSIRAHHRHKSLITKNVFKLHKYVKIEHSD